MQGGAARAPGLQSVYGSAVSGQRGTALARPGMDLERYLLAKGFCALLIVSSNQPGGGGG